MSVSPKYTMLTISRRLIHQRMIEDLNIIVHLGNISSKFSSNSEADASELLENLEEMFPRYL